MKTKPSTFPVLCFVLLGVRGVAAQETQPAEFKPYAATIAGDHVNVRSGPDINHYAVTQLDSGHKVRVVDGRFDWLAIEPPSDCFSLIDKAYVDRAEGKRGIVNGSGVWVHAGSALNNQTYAKQVRLERGTEVEVLGDAEGYYKIKPPPGAKVWVHSQFVRPLEATTRPAAETVRPVQDQVSSAEAPAPEQPGASGSPATQPSARTPTTRPSLPAPQPPTPTEPGERIVAGSSVGAHSPGTLSGDLDEISELIKLELQRPPAERQFEPILARLRPIAGQEEDQVARLVAERRIQQLEDMKRMVSALSDLRREAQGLAADRRRLAESRQDIAASVPRPPEAGFTIEGELRPSQIFSSDALGPIRYRLVDPKAEAPQTAAYVEFPAESRFDPNDFLGRMVRIRSRDRYFQSGSVDPIMVYVVGDIELIGSAGAPSGAPGT